MPIHDERLRYTRLQRARASLEGLSVGDAFGEQFFMSFETAATLIQSGKLPGPPYDFSDDEAIRLLIAERQLPAAPASGELRVSGVRVRGLASTSTPTGWPFTDDTQMALSVVENLRRYGEINPDELALSFSRRYDNTRGYGAAMHELLPRLARESWREAAPALFDGQGSFGNGAAMRVAPVGAYFADDLDAVIENARRSALVTHAHPEAAAGAIAVALAAALLGQARGASSAWNGRDFLKQILDLTPRSEVQEGIRHARGMLDEDDVREAAAVLGTGERVTAQDTVPFCLWCAARHPDSFEDALWLTVSGLGDRDTTCAIVGGIVAAGSGSEGIPAAWLQAREPLPDWPFAA